MTSATNHGAAEALAIASRLVTEILKERPLTPQAAVTLLGLTFESILHGEVRALSAEPPATSGAQAEAASAKRVVTEAPQATRRDPAVPISESITRDWIICLEDGKRCKMLKRHLTHLGMTPAEYRRKWNLPDDYPMTAPSYAKEKSEFAIAVGLGTAPNKQGMTREQTVAALAELATVVRAGETVDA